MGYTKITTTKTLTRFLIEEQRRFNHATGGFTGLINDVRLACKRIARVIGKGALADALGSVGTTNVQGETQMKLDVMANEIFVKTSLCGDVNAQLSITPDGSVSIYLEDRFQHVSRVVTSADGTARVVCDDQTIAKPAAKKANARPATATKASAKAAAKPKAPHALEEM